MKLFACLAIAGVAGAASAQVLWDQSQLVNMPNAGTGTIAGQHLSMLETGENNFGFNCQAPLPDILADDFTVGAGGATVTGFTVFCYLTGATTPGVTSIGWSIGSAPTPAAGLTTTSATSTFWSTAGANVYRVNVGDTGSTGGLREVQVVNVTGLNISLAAGTYFLSWDQTGATFAPSLPTSLATHGQNMQQAAGAAGTFAPVLQGTVGADMAFIINGRPVPEPASFAVLGLGALVLLRRRRK
jgi:hypothetical protein